MKTHRWKHLNHSQCIQTELQFFFGATQCFHSEHDFQVLQSVFYWTFPTFYFLISTFTSMVTLLFLLYLFSDNLDLALRYFFLQSSALVFLTFSIICLYDKAPSNSSSLSYLTSSSNLIFLLSWLLVDTVCLALSYNSSLVHL